MAWFCFDVALEYFFDIWMEKGFKNWCIFIVAADEQPIETVFLIK